MYNPYVTEIIKAASVIREQLIKLHAYSKWKQNTLKRYNINGKTTLNELLVLMLRRAVSTSSPTIAMSLGSVMYDTPENIFRLFTSSHTSFLWSNTEEGSSYWNGIFTKTRESLKYQ